MRVKMLVLGVGVALGVLLSAWAPWDRGDEPGGGGEALSEPEILYWVAPMDPNFRRDEPGKSPMGMDLVPVYAKDAATGGGVQISPRVEQNLGVRTTEVTRGRLWRMVRAVGQVDVDESAISHVHPRTSGWLEELVVNATGESAKAGDVIGRLYSPDLVNAQKEYLQAAARGSAAIQAGALEKLRALGMHAQDQETLTRTGKIIESARLLAPRDGVVISLGVREGMYVTPETELLSIADLASVWVRADVFEAQADWLALGQAAELRLDYRPGQVFEGSVELIEPVVNPATRTVQVRLRFDNPEGALKPGMYGKVRIFGGAKRNILIMPLDALIRGETMDRVVVAQGDGHFEVREVRAGFVSGDWVEVLAGLDEGDKVVVSAQFLIDSEASISGEIRRLGGSPAPASPQAVTITGRIETVNDDGSITVAHGPVPELGWPPMTMNFVFRDGYDADRGAAGARVELAIERHPVRSWEITGLERIGAAPGDGP